jgi:hypothetical protein
MPAKLFLIFSAVLILTITPKLWAADLIQDQTLEIMVKKTDITASAKLDELFALNAVRQALTSELVKNNLDTEAFWAKVEARKLSDKEEIELFKPLFSKFNVTINPNQVANDQFQRGTFSYLLDPSSFNKFYIDFMADAPDVSVKTFYIIPDIGIAGEMSWIDVGVTKKENFSGVIIDSWKKWATTHFKNFTNVVVLEKDFTTKPSNMNAESVTLKWNSSLKKGEVFQDRKSAKYELTAQFVLVNTKNNHSLVAFDFPTQKRELAIYNPKDLSSNLASLIYNLLNSQTVKITSALEQNLATSSSSIVELKLVGKAGLFDITQLNSFLNEQFKDIALVSELKSYGSDGSILSIKSTLSPDALYTRFAKQGGKFPLNEQKLLLFSSENKTFAIISKEANN